MYVGDSAGGSAAEDGRLEQGEGNGWVKLVLFGWEYDAEILLDIGGSARILLVDG